MQDAIKMLQRIASALEAALPKNKPLSDIKNADAYIWNAQEKELEPVQYPESLELELLKNIDEQKETLLANTKQFANGFPANNVLLWGARGMGKSSLIKAVHSHINKENPHSVVLVEIGREDIGSLHELIKILRGWVIRRFIIFCDDLSFDTNDNSYKSLKSALEGNIEGQPAHILFYATSNRRHLMAREMIENEKKNAIHGSDVIEEKISLSDRFGIWLGFHSCSQDAYLAMVEAYSDYYDIKIDHDDLKKQALEWAMTRGARSGRVAQQFIYDLAGRSGKKI
ncbi:MAG: ATP-binding protein [Rickettsiales bacterium]